MNAPIRCGWVPTDDELYCAYHDQEWGVPVHDSQTLFELINLEGAQAGLSWITVLRKREHYRKVFAGFDPVKVARFTPAKIEKLLQDPGIIRNKLKVNGVVKNAKAYLAMEQAGEDFAEFIWSFVDGKPIDNGFARRNQVPATTPISDQMSKALKKRGFTFVGSTICYAFMQAAGLVNDHTKDCFRYDQV